jgi:5-formyltetrahydrofolate cyclo-ligase
LSHFGGCQAAIKHICHYKKSRQGEPVGFFCRNQQRETMITKEEVRVGFPDAPERKISGKCAEAVRRLERYRDAKRIFVGPAARLQQIRINALTDGKELLVPAPGLKEGFYLLAPYGIPFKHLSFAVGYNGLAQYGRKVAGEELGQVPVGLLVTDCLAVDPAGYFVGEGNGFFDLAVAILAELHGLAPQAEAYGVGEPAQILAQEIEHGGWDVRLNGFITVEGIILPRSGGHADRRVLWEMLPSKRIRKITPLWKLNMQIKDGLRVSEKQGD